MSLYFSQFEDIGKLPNLRHISLVHLESVEKADQLLLQGESAARRSAFQFLQKPTFLELGAHRHAPVTSAEYQGLSHLTDLQHITLERQPFPALTSGHVPCSILMQLSALTSLEVDQLEHGVSRLTRLQSLSVLSSGRYQFTQDFSILQCLTALAVGPTWNPAQQNLNDALMRLCDLESLKVLCSIQKLIMKGTMGWYVPAGGTQHGARWEELATFTSIKHLDVGDSCYTEDTFTNLAKMTQLTYLSFALKSCDDHVHASILDAQLTALSTLASLNVLRFHFFCYPCPLVWSPQDQQYVTGPMPSCGVALRAALPQAASM